nr:PEP-CTERM sorting domain-containing protein [uncultured Desulfobulbus sp.]
MKKFTAMFLGGFLFCNFTSSANAGHIDWVDWTSSGNKSAQGTLAGGTIAVTYNGEWSFVQTGAGTNYWTEGSPAPYTGNSVVDNAPTPAEGIALSTAGTKTITFSQAVLNPVFAFNSWNGNSIDFGTAITILSTGQGYWGSGSIALAADGKGWNWISGEPHGVLQLTGTFTSITFTDTLNENWHGFTIGIEGVAPPNNPVPEPTAMLLFGTGLAGLAAVGRRRK